MATSASIPRANAPLSYNDGTPTREWYNFLRSMNNASGNAVMTIEGEITTIAYKLGSSDGTVGNIPLLTSGGTVRGQQSISSVGAFPGVVILNLLNDVQTPGNTQYYGSDSTGAKGWWNIYDAFGSTEAAGDLIYAATATTLDRLPISTDGDVLTLVSGLPAWQAPSGGAGGDEFAVATGADTITATFSPAPTLADGLQFKVRAAAANATTTPTFNPNSLGALSVTKLGGVALADGDISGAGHELIIRYVAAVPRYELVNPASVQSITGGSHISVDITDPRKPAVSVSGTFTGSGYAEGTSFPSSPALNDKFYRNDLNLLCYYDGTRWLTCNEYAMGVGGVQAMENTGTASFRAIFPARSDHAFYVTRLSCSTLVVSGNSGSNHYTLILEFRTTANVATTLATLSTSADGNSVWANHDQAINTALTTTVVMFDTNLTKTGSPGLLYAPCVIYYRLIVT